jgi:hypothetical protein
METTINWIAGDQLDTHTASYIFRGQDKGRLYFYNPEIGCEFIESPKIVTAMVRDGQWKAIDICDR